jgi:hypothetical protein
MGRIRSIKPEITQSATLGRLRRECRLCFILLFTLADDEGRLRGDANLLAGLLFPYDSDARQLISGWLEDLAAVGAIQWYEVDGQAYVQICKWQSHQKVDHAKRSTFPPPPQQVTGTPKPLAKLREDSRGAREDECLDQGRDQGGDRRGGEPRALAPVVVMAPQTPRYARPMGGKHGTCLAGCATGMCLPEEFAMELAARLPGGFTEQGLEDTVKWAEVVIEDRKTRGLGMPDRNVHEFWKNRWAEHFGGSAPSFAELRAKKTAAAFDEAFNG